MRGDSLGVIEPGLEHVDMATAERHEMELRHAELPTESSGPDLADKHDSAQTTSTRPI
jgi:hypothetical protein